jgi:hypothetical protein
MLYANLFWLNFDIHNIKKQQLPANISSIKAEIYNLRAYELLLIFIVLISFIANINFIFMRLKYVIFVKSNLCAAAFIAKY